MTAVLHKSFQNVSGQQKLNIATFLSTKVLNIYLHNDIYLCQGKKAILSGQGTFSLLSFSQTQSWPLLAWPKALPLSYIHLLQCTGGPVLTSGSQGEEQQGGGVQSLASHEQRAGVGVGAHRPGRPAEGEDETQSPRAHRHEEGQDRKHSLCLQDCNTHRHTHTHAYKHALRIPTRDCIVSDIQFWSQTNIINDVAVLNLMLLAQFAFLHATDAGMSIPAY